MANKPIPTPLIADLPEDWEINDTLSPSGTDVGLTEQHGYNYLMGKVNEAVEAINTLNDGFENTGGFTLMETSIPTADRQPNTLYGLILGNYGGES